MKAAALLVAFLQTISPPAVRVGSVAPSLTEDDLAVINQEAAARGGSPWLIDAQQGGSFLATLEGSFYSWTVRVLLQANSASALLRRGECFTMVTVAQPGAHRWNVVPSRACLWAQISVPGRSFEDVTSEHDTNLPFSTDGAVPDEELVSVVRFVRASRSFAAKRLVRGYPYDRFPVYAVTRDYENGIPTTLVSLRTSAYSSGIQYKLRRTSGAQWTIVRGPLFFGSS